MPQCNLMQLTSNTNEQTIIPVCQKLILVHCSIKQGSVDLVICFSLLLQILYIKSWNSSMALVILCYWHHLNLSLTPTMPKWIFELVTLKVSDFLHPHICPFMVCTGPSEDLYLSWKPFMINSNSVLTVRLCSNMATLILKINFVHCSVY
jgi:hypothetical protein